MLIEYGRNALAKAANIRAGRGEQINVASMMIPQKTTLWQRTKDAARYMIAGVGPENWFGPNQPLPPFADEEGPSGARGRRYDYPVGVNLSFQPRSEEAVTFQTLRNLADAYDLLRLVIETRKDQIASYDWSIVPVDAKATGMESEIKRVSDFFQRPDREHSWQEWSRMIMEDLLVVDGAVIYPRMTRGGKPYALDLIAPETITVMRDIEGRLPASPSPAYQQILKGIPAVDYNADELIYLMRNPRTWKRYGYSPVEQIIMTVNIALRRQVYTLDYYKEGNIPDALIGVPETWTPDQIKEFQAQFDDMMATPNARRKLHFIPEAKTMMTPREASVALKDETDEWLARLVCYAFSVPPIALVKMVNRAAGEQIANAAKEEGLLPYLRWFAARMTDIVQRYLQAPGLKFDWKMSEEIDPRVQAEVLTTYVGKGIISLDEARDDLGRDARGVDELIVMTQSGPVPLKEALEMARNPPEPMAAPGAVPAKPGAKAEAKADEKKSSDDAEKAIHIHMGDTIVRSPAINTPDVYVDIGGIAVKADIYEKAPAPSKVVRKVIKGHRNENGELVGEVEEIHEGADGVVAKIGGNHD